MTQQCVSQMRCQSVLTLPSNAPPLTVRTENLSGWFMGFIMEGRIFK